MIVMSTIANRLLLLSLPLLLVGTLLAETVTVPVEIESVDANDRKITVRHNGKVTTLALNADAKIILAGKATELHLLIPGDTGNVEFDKTISAVTKIDVRRREMAPAETLSEGWEEIDQRLLFLMVRLVDVEANLDATDKAMGKSNVRAGIASAQASRAQAGNDRMDRRAGGPVRWDKFYGTTAEKFFYHPNDNHTYHTRTILSQQSPGNDNQIEPGVPSRQGLPVHQRPPQFDYMYRANENAQRRAEADVAKFRGKGAALAARRHELELEQSKLWCEVAFRAVARNDLDRKPIYRFAPSGQGNEDLLAATNFVTTALSVVENGQKNQASTFRQIKPLISNARYDLDNKWLQLRIEHRDESTDEGRFAALARRLEDVSANLGDSYTVSVERERAGDSDRRDLYRGLLQQALLQYAETVLALDEMASEMAKAKSFEPALDSPIPGISWPLANSTSSTNNEEPKSSSSEPVMTHRKKPYPDDAISFGRHHYKFFPERLSWKDAAARCRAMGGHLPIVNGDAENDFIFRLAFSNKKVQQSDGVWLGATDERVEGRWVWVDGSTMTYSRWLGNQPNNKNLAEHFLLLWMKDNRWVDQPNESHQHSAYFVCEWDE